MMFGVVELKVIDQVFIHVVHRYVAMVMLMSHASHVYSLNGTIDWLTWIQDY